MQIARMSAASVVVIAGLFMAGCSNAPTAESFSSAPASESSTAETAKRTLADLPEGEVAYQEASTVKVDGSGNVWLDATAEALPESGGEAYTRIERVDDGYTVWLDERSRFAPQELPEDTSYAPVVAVQTYKNDGWQTFNVLPESRYSYKVTDMQVGDIAYSTSWPVWHDVRDRYWLLKDEELYRTKGKPYPSIDMRIERREDGYHVWLSESASSGDVQMRMDPHNHVSGHDDYVQIAEIH